MQLFLEGYLEARVMITTPLVFHPQFTKALSSDGTQVELEKDCECPEHEGPHFLFFDYQLYSQAESEARSGNLQLAIAIEKHRAYCFRRALADRSIIGLLV